MLVGSQLVDAEAHSVTHLSRLHILVAIEQTSYDREGNLDAKDSAGEPLALALMPIAYLIPNKTCYKITELAYFT